MARFPAYNKRDNQIMNNVRTTTNVGHILFKASPLLQTQSCKTQ